MNLGTGPCPSTHPYVYNSGSHCCATQKENFQADKGEACDGSQLEYDSDCCENHDYHVCGHAKCRDNFGG